MAGGVNRVARCRILRCTTNSFAATPATIPKRISSRSAHIAMTAYIADKTEDLAGLVGSSCDRRIEVPQFFRFSRWSASDPQFTPRQPDLTKIL